MLRRTVVALLLSALLAACGASEDGPVEANSRPLRAEETTGGASNESRGDDRGSDEPELELVLGDDPCETDADCVPASCCHASACVAAGGAPSCGDVMCTMDCRAGTMDCGGGCLCQGGRCAARVMPRADMAVQ